MGEALALGVPAFAGGALEVAPGGPLRGCGIIPEGAGIEGSEPRV
jgi:hypothetical protein